MRAGAITGFLMEISHGVTYLCQTPQIYLVPNAESIQQPLLKYSPSKNRTRLVSKTTLT